MLQVEDDRWQLLGAACCCGPGCFCSLSAGCPPLLQLEAACATPPAADYISFDCGRPQQPAAAHKAAPQQAQHPGPAELAPETLRQGQAKATAVTQAVKAAQPHEQGQAKPAGADARKRKALPEEHIESAKQQKVAALQTTLPVASSSRPASTGEPASPRQGGEARAVHQQQHQTPSLRPGATIFRPQSHAPVLAAASEPQNVAAGPPARQAAAAAAPASSGEGRVSASSAGAPGGAPIAAKLAAPANSPAAGKPAAGGRQPSAAVAATAQPGAVYQAEGPNQQLKAAAPVQPGRPAAEAGSLPSTAPASGVSSPLSAGRPASTAPEQQPAVKPPSPAGRMGLQLPPGSSPPVGWPPQQFAGLAPGFVPSPQPRRMFGSPTAPRSNGSLPASPQSVPFRLGQQLQPVPQPLVFTFNPGLAAYKPAGPPTLRPRVPGPQPPPLTGLQQQSAGQKRKASGQEARSGAPMASTSPGAALRGSDTAAATMGQLGRPPPGSLARPPASHGRGQAHPAKPASHGAAATKQAAAANLAATAATFKQPAAAAAAAARPPEALAEPSNDFARSAIVAELRSFDAMFTTAMKDDSYLTKALRKGPFIRQSWKRVRSWHGLSYLALVALGLKWLHVIIGSLPAFYDVDASSCWVPVQPSLMWRWTSCHLQTFACKLPHSPRYWPAPALGLQLYSAHPSICHVLFTVSCNGAPAQGPPNICHSDLQLQLIGNLYAININVNTAQAANVGRAVEGRRFHGVPPPKASYVTLHRRNNSSLKTDHGWRLVSTSEFALRSCKAAKLQYVLHVQLLSNCGPLLWYTLLRQPLCAWPVVASSSLTSTGLANQSSSAWPSYRQHGRCELLLSCVGSLHGSPARSCMVSISAPDTRSWGLMTSASFKLYPQTSTVQLRAVSLTPGLQRQTFKVPQAPYYMRCSFASSWSSHGRKTSPWGSGGRQLTLPSA